MKRHLYAKLISWKTGKSRKPLLLQGARQVGKTYLVKAFGEKEYLERKSFLFDVKIFFMTFTSAFLKKEGVSH